MRGVFIVALHRTLDRREAAARGVARRPRAAGGSRSLTSFIAMGRTGTRPMPGHLSLGPAPNDGSNRAVPHARLAESSPDDGGLVVLCVQITQSLAAKQKAALRAKGCCEL